MLIIVPVVDIIRVITIETTQDFQSVSKKGIKLVVALIIAKSIIVNTRSCLFFIVLNFDFGTNVRINLKYQMK